MSQRETSRKYYERHKEEIKQKMHERYLKHKVEISIKNKARRKGSFRANKVYCTSNTSCSWNVNSKCTFTGTCEYQIIVEEE